MSVKEIVQATYGKWLGERDLLTVPVIGVTTDSRKITSGNLFVPLIGDQFDGHQFVQQALEQGAALSLWQENHLPPPTGPVILVKDTLSALQSLASYYRKKIGIPIVAVTGSNGKTTVKDLIASVLSVRYKVYETKGNLNNHIGLPLTLLSIPSDTEIGVVEMGMNHFGEISLLSKIANPDIAVITNIGESHIQFLGSREGISRAKLEILDGLKSDGYLIIDGDEPLLTSKIGEIAAHVVRCGFDLQNDFAIFSYKLKGLRGMEFFIKGEGNSFTTNLIGKHHLKNLLYTIAVAKLFGLSSKEIKKGLQNPQMTKMRMEVIQGKNQIEIVNDAYNASPTSVKAAVSFLSALEGRQRVLVLGDMLELGDEENAWHYEVGNFISSQNIDILVTYGPRSRYIHQGAIESGFSSERAYHFLNKEELISTLIPLLTRDAVIVVKASRGMALETIIEHLL
ncbi:UDP-N-acetylmuramoyl-tripeptide--D-alanyl-D-alanine ligase [Microaerobacter geothermalis]|uniref:UDP-N-acetylmuramoyl-tripeptide--D-alanyl-D- alanine ligase n=1 Tax=Microaerobacter geothermalis TaxID=674972 RepID=UPI001F1A0EAE|nr:UDP-N-acetylmuramoyl-tripeptide--D-alanyl-D-alanine ligase [Microaerobacter geothermalis]MCF6093601.1 UDP-N-acetylmuramoyl-tripeptide--D-alanyl-D-alanine ligase [Microaerobacter geothermalis]